MSTFFERETKTLHRKFMIFGDSIKSTTELLVFL